MGRCTQRFRSPSTTDLRVRSPDTLTRHVRIARLPVGAQALKRRARIEHEEAEREVDLIQHFFSVHVDVMPAPQLLQERQDTEAAARQARKLAKLKADQEVLQTPRLFCMLACAVLIPTSPSPVHRSRQLWRSHRTSMRWRQWLLAHSQPKTTSS